MKHLKIYTTIFYLILFFTGCATMKTKQSEFTNCPVCGMKVDKAEAYTYKYNSAKYYFDSYNCKEAFKMNPEKVIKK